MKARTDFDPEKIIKTYRAFIAIRERKTTKANIRPEVDRTLTTLRKSWEAWQGGDSLHEMAFGEPVE